MIRPAQARDVAAWAAMRLQLWPDADPIELAREAAQFVAGVKQPALDAALVYEHDAAPVGFVELSIRPFADGCDAMPIPYVEAWFVEESARGRGIGRALLDAGERWARERGFTEIGSDTELHNVGSQRAHAACGYAEVERQVKFRKAL
ncbi:MAG TPA: GNAT family N-acetyltransferase [Candidatus Elarobacter sp.]